MFCKELAFVVLRLVFSVRLGVAVFGGRTTTTSVLSVVIPMWSDNLDICVVSGSI